MSTPDWSWKVAIIFAFATLFCISIGAMHEIGQAVENGESEWWLLVGLVLAPIGSISIMMVLAGTAVIIQDCRIHRLGDRDWSPVHHTRNNQEKKVNWQREGF